MNVLISSSGRRVGLINCFRESLAELGMHGRIVAIDAGSDSPSRFAADDFYVVPKCSDPGFLTEVHDICEREQISLIVPTIDPELSVYASAREEFANSGVQIAVSSPEAVAICGDKILTHKWLVDQGLPVPRQATPDEILENRFGWKLPLIVKPVQGSASNGIVPVRSFSELELIARGNSSLLVQELIQGDEYTVNVFVDRQQRCVCAVPHRRIETRHGEVSKGLTVKNRALMEMARLLVEALPGAFGALNIQCFVTPERELKIIEVNARFGGGYPLTHRAGATVSTWLLQECAGLRLLAAFDDWQDGLMMLRYDEAVYVTPDQRRYENRAGALSCVRSG